MTLLLELLEDASTNALEVHSTKLRQGPATGGLLSPNPSRVVSVILLGFRKTMCEAVGLSEPCHRWEFVRDPPSKLRIVSRRKRDIVNIQINFSLAHTPV